MKTTDVYGIGNAIIDIPVSIPADLLSQLSFSRGSSSLVSAQEQHKILEQVRPLEGLGQFTAAGSVANSIVTVSELFGKSAFAARLAGDEYGKFYKDDFARLKVNFGNPFIIGGTSGTSVVLITPDGERTMRTCLGVSAELSPDDLDQNLVNVSKWIFIEGYLFANGESAREAIAKAVDYAKASQARHRTNVALTFSDASIVKAFKNEIEKILPQTDLIFANRGESMAFTGATSPQAALEELRKVVPNVIVTAGSAGAYIHFHGQETHVPAKVCTPIDTTGAGDAFAGGFLYGITNGYSPEQAAHGGAALASKVIQVYGARLAKGVREAWEEGVKTS